MRSFFNAKSPRRQDAKEQNKSLGRKAMRLKPHGLGVLASWCSGLGSLSATVAILAITTAALAGGDNIQVKGVAAGSAQIQRNGANAIIHASDGTIINYSRFDVPLGADVRFIQPGATARVLNRIHSAAPSTINGSLNANGVIYFLNPAGIVFGPHSTINAAQFYAAAGNLSNQNFLEGINHFTDLHGSVVNMGYIGAGSVSLLGRHVANYGSIVANHGVVTMAAGNDVLLGPPHGSILVRLGKKSDIGQAASDDAAGVNNAGTVRANGKISLVAGDIYSLAVNNSGTLASRDIAVKGGDHGKVLVAGTLDASNNQRQGGRITVNGGQIGIGVQKDARGDFVSTSAHLDASGTTGGGTILIGVKPDATSHTGYSDASAYDFISGQSVLNANATGTEGSGGFIDTSGQTLTIAHGARISAAGAPGGDAGRWLLDPADITIKHTATVGDMTGTGTGTDPDTFQPASTVSIGTIYDSDLNTALAATNVLVTTTNTGTAGIGTGNITIDSAAAINPTLTKDVTLTLQADNAINMGNGATITATNTGGNTFTLGVNFTADSNNAGSSPDITIGGPITTLGGDFTATTGGSGSVIFNTGGSVDTATGTQTYNAPVTLGANVNLTAAAVTFNNTVAGGTHDLIITSDAVFGDAATDTVTGLGTLHVTGTAAINTNTVTTSGTQTYDGAVTLGAGAAETFTGSAVTFDNTLTGDAQDVKIDGIGTFGAISNVGAMEVTGAATFNGTVAANKLTADSASTINAATITTIDRQTYTGPVTLGANTALISSGNLAITFESTMDGAHSLTVTTSGDTNFGDGSGNDWVGHTNPLTSVTTNGGGTTVFNVAGSTTLTSTITTTGGQTYDDAVGLQLDTVLTSTTSGAIAFNSTVDGAASLTINTAGATTFGDGTGTDLVGDATALSSLTTDSAGTTTFNAAGTTADPTVTTTGAQTYNDPVTLAADVNLTGSAVTFDGTVAGGTNDLTVTGNAVFGDAAADTVTGVAALDVTGTTAINTNITTTGTQTYEGAVTLGNDAALSATGAAADIWFKSTVGGAHSLTAQAGQDVDIDKAVTLTGTGTLALAADHDGNGTGDINIAAAGGLSVAGTTISLTAHDLAITLGGTINAGSASTGTINLVASDGGTIGLGDTGGDMTVSGAELAAMTAGTLNLGDATSGAITVDNITAANSTNIGQMKLTTGGTNAVSFVNNASAFNALDVTSGTGGIVISQNITTGGAQTYHDSVTLGANPVTLTTTNSAVEFGSTVNSAAGDANGLTINSGAGNITFVGAVGGLLNGELGALNANSAGTMKFAGTVKAASVTTDASGTTELDGDVTTSGDQTYHDAVTLGASANLAGSQVAFDGAVVGGTHNLTITGNAVFGDAATDTVTGVGVLDVTGASAINTNTVTTSGNQTYAGAATLGADATLSTTNSNVAFGGTVDSASGQTNNLTVNAGTGNVTFTGAVGGGTNGSLGDLIVDSASATAGQGITTFSSTVNATSLTTDAGTGGATKLGGDVITTNGQTYNDAVELTGDVTLDSTAGNGAIAFGSTVDNATAAAEDLTVNAGAGNVTFTGAAGYGANGPLGDVAVNTTGTTNFSGAVEAASVTTDAGGGTNLLSGDVVTTNGQTYGDTVTLGGDTHLTGSQVTFDAPVAGGGNDLRVTANAVFGNQATDTVTNLDALTVNGTATINTSNITSGFKQTYDGVVTLGTDPVTLTAGGLTWFKSALNAASNGASALTITGAGSSAQFEGIVGGGGKALKSLHVTGASAINSAAVTTTAAQMYDDAVTLGADTNLTGSQMAFGSTVAGGTHDLTVSGDAVFGDAATDTVTGVGALDITGTSAINTNTVTTSGTQTYGGAVTLEADNTTLTGATVIFGNTVSGAHNLKVAGAVDINGGSVTTTGKTQEYTGQVTLGANTNLTGSAVTFDDKVAGGTHELTVTGNAIFGNAAADTVTGVGVLDVTGTSDINTNTVNTSGTQTYHDAVTLGNNPVVTLTTTNSAVDFGSTVDSTASDVDGLTVNAGSGDITFTGAVGGAANGELGALTANSTGTTAFNSTVRAASLTTNAGGTTSLKGNVSTANGQSYGDALILNNNIILTDTGTGATSHGIAFGSTIDGDASGTRGLTVQVNETETAAGLPVISFGGDVGDTHPLTWLRLNTLQNTRTGALIPTVATIVAPQSLTIHATSEVNIGQNEKLTVLGDLVIEGSGDNATGTIDFGDINTLGSLDLSGASLQLQRRDAGQLLASDGFMRDDAGVDIIVGKGTPSFGKITLAGTSDKEPQILSQAPPKLTFSGGGVIQTRVFSSPSEVTRNVFIYKNNDTGISTILDLASASFSSTTTQTVSSAIAGALPKESLQSQVPQGTSLQEALLKQLYAMGIPARQVSPAEFLSQLTGAIYHDYRYYIGPRDFQVAATRLSTDLARKVLAEKRAMLVNLKTGKTEKNFDFIREALSTTVASYIKMTGDAAVKPQGFENYLAWAATSPKASDHDAARQARQSLNQLGEIYRDMRLLGLNNRELSYAEMSLAGAMRPNNLTVDQLIALATPK